MSYKKTKIIYITLNLILYIAILFYFKASYTDDIEKYLLKVGIIATGILLFNLYFFIKEYKYNFQLILFEIALICFLFGDCYGYFFIKKDLLMFRFAKGNTKWVKETYFYSLQFLTIMNVGLIIGGEIKSKNKKEFNLKKMYKYKKIFDFILKILILINGVLILFIIKNFLEDGYKQVNIFLDSGFQTLTFLKYSLNFFIIFLCFFNKKIRLYKIIYLLMSGLLFFLGSRSLAVGQILIFILYEHVINDRKINLKHCGLLGILSVLIPLFAYIRVGEKFDFMMLKKGPFLVVKELGQATPMILTLQYVPRYRNFEYGRSFIDAIARIFRLDRLFYTPMEYGSTWVTKIEGTSWGLGYSSVAESYMNFGKYLVVYALILGIIYGYFLIIKDNKNMEEKIAMLLSAPILYFSLRSDFAYTMLFLFYYVVVFKILLKFLIYILDIIRRSQKI